MCVCEPQAVSTAATYCGAAGLLMSKTLMPSQEFFSVADCEALAQESVDSTRMSPRTEMSFCEPGHTTCVTRVGAVGLLMS